MRPLILIGSALAAGIAYAFKGKKANAAEAIEADGSVEVTPDGATQATGTVTVPPSVLIPGTPKLTIPTGSTVIKSPGLPPLPTIGTGPTSGATSVTPTGVIDDAFDVLIANAIAKGDIALLEELAKQAELRGLPAVAASIRAEIARIKGAAPAPTIAKPPTTAPVSTYLGRATISMKAGSRGPDVVEWQRIIGTKQDGIFGPITDTLTRQWQRTHVDPATGKALVVDGIVGPRTWASAYAVKPTLATAPRTTAPAPIPAPTVVKAPTTSTTSYTTIKLGSRGETVKTWQRMLGNVTVDGIFGSQTDSATRIFQKSKGLVVDGIVGPKTWGAMLAQQMVAPAPAPVSVVVPAPTTIVESDMRKAARELTDYLKSIGGLAGRPNENKTKVKGYQSRLALTADGMYGRNSAKAIIIQGFVPVVPYYWPSTGTTTAKNEFTSFVKQYADSDPARRAEWDKLLSDIQRS